MAVKAKVNGVVYDDVKLDRTTGQLTLTSKDGVEFTTTMEELKTYYGRRTSYEVEMLMRAKGVK